MGQHICRSGVGGQWSSLGQFIPSTGRSEDQDKLQEGLGWAATNQFTPRQGLGTGCARIGYSTNQQELELGQARLSQAEAPTN